MRLGTMIAIGCLAAASLGPGAVRAGLTQRLQVGNWNGGVWVDDKSGEFRNCGLGLKFNAGTQLTVVVAGNYNVAILVADPRIAATAQQRFEATVKFENGPEQKTPALALSPTLVQLAAPPLPDSYDTLRESKRLSLVVPGLTTTVDVTGLDKVLPRLLECVATERAKAKLAPSQAAPGLPQDRLEAGFVGLAAAEKVGAPYIVFADGKRPPGFDRPVTLWGHAGVPGPDGPANIMGMTFWNAPLPNDGAPARREARKALIGKACADGSLQMADLPGVDGRADSFGIGFTCQNKYEEIYFVPRRNGGWFEIGLNSPPGKKGTLAAFGAKYRAALGGILP